MSLVDDLCVVLSSYHGGYRLMRRRMHGDTRSAPLGKLHDASYGTLAVTLSRLKKRGLVRNDKGAWYLTKLGVTRLRERLRVPPRFHGAASSKQQKNMIVMFDIPERKRRARAWLRFALMDLGFTLLQKSVWFGPAPLPKEFVVSLRDVGILPYVKFFKAQEADVV